ncbi:MAG: outer membrane beta-barrel protein [Bryobacteraceae bacterium]
MRTLFVPRTSLFFSLLICTLAVAMPAFPQAAEVYVTGGASLLSNNSIGFDTLTTGSDTGYDIKLTDGFRLGFRLNINPGKFYGHEFGYAYNRTKFRLETPPATEYGTSIHTGFYDFLFHFTPEGSRIRPFVAAGVQFSTYAFPGYSAASGGGSTKFGVNYGTGVKVKVSSLYAVRLDIRQYRNPKPFDFPGREGWLRQTEISGGFGITF